MTTIVSNRLKPIPQARLFRWAVIGSSFAFRHRLSGLYDSSAYCKCSNSVPFHVPITLSVHISLGVRYSPVSLTVPVTQYGVSYFRFLLHRTDPHLSVRTFLYGKHLDPYIRGFRQSVVDNSHHRYFVDSRRVICIQYLYRTFVSRVATLLRQTSADFIELQTPAFTAGAGRSIREGISGRYPVILPFELSVVAYPLRR